MRIVARKVDQWLYIGSDTRVSPTDIDPTGVRMIARGRTVGGPDDGATFDKVCDLGIGQTCHFGPHIAVTILEVKGLSVRLGVLAPPHIAVSIDPVKEGGT